MLSLKNINKRFGNETVLKDLSAEFTGGLNFIIGPSGSGKSTLLKLISGMDNEFDGKILFKGKSLKDFSKSDLNNYYYNSVGFVWQNFQLINHLSVEDNIMLVLNLSPLTSDEKNKKVKLMLNKLGISNLAKSKISKLSGGQKQRVAIARSLIKNPEIIIADEPTGALDAKSSQVIMDVLKNISKERLVIIVTHDKNLIDKNSNCFLLKNGKLKNNFKNEPSVGTVKSDCIRPVLSFKNAIIQAFKNIKGLSLKFALTSVILVLSSFFLLMNLSGQIQNKQDDIYNQLVKERGDNIKDIYVGANTTTSSGRGLQQDAFKTYDVLNGDSGVEYIYAGLSIDDQTINIGDIVKDYKPQNSNCVPTVHKLLSGRMPNSDEMEVAVPKTLLDKFNLKAEDVIGKNLNMTGHQRTSRTTKSNVSLNDLTIVGVIDSTFYGQEKEDFFIYSLKSVNEIFKQTGLDKSKLDARIRAKTLEDILPIVGKLQKAGLTPGGDFSQIQDMLSLKSTNENQGTLISTIFLSLSVIISLSLTIINSYLRKAEHAVLKINGYSNKSILNLTMFEYLQVSLISTILFLITLPILNTLSIKLFDMYISGKNSLYLSIVIVIIQGLVIGFVSSIISFKINPSKNLKIGDV
ncbi:ATP-binding cassette domain-containing protein [Clostridium frigidicarnis]|uniref:ABC-type lipoprotein export system, ATPase component n=1 Tax=Clostridium frigidicarnis TaxID=84698 RepID=A0A1I1AGH7_9CLOT|nr:ATP-binding cassette domain-containing protein [Clostridium frigidicarnis]SFB36592.1 ABC-type lipoprotein export system, ATPase component [Clostridium frigidicarnis]